MSDTTARDAPGTADALIARTTTAQSELQDLLQGMLGGAPTRVRPLELVYFSAAMMTYVYMRFGDDANPRVTLDRFTCCMLRKGLQSAGSPLSLNAAAHAYRARFGQYNALAAALFSPHEEESEVDPAAMLFAHAFECITQSSRSGHALGIWSASEWMLAFLLDLIIFVKQELEQMQPPHA